MDPNRPPRDGRTLARRLAIAQGAWFVSTGVWPLAHEASFEAVTGPKRERWLVKTVGVLVAVVGTTLAGAARRGAAATTASTREAER